MISAKEAREQTESAKSRREHELKLYVESELNNINNLVKTRVSLGQREAVLIYPEDSMQYRIHEALPEIKKELEGLGFVVTVSDPILNEGRLWHTTTYKLTITW